MTDDVQSGLYLGFEGYKSPSLDDQAAVLSKGMVVPDANVLLNLYRYTNDARDNLLTVLERLSDRLWIPHQVLEEFWRNRESVLRDPRDTEKTSREMRDSRTQAVARFRAWANRVSLPGDSADPLVAALEQGFDAALRTIEAYSDSGAAESARDTNKDPVLRRLEPIFTGRVGAPMTSTQYERAVAEALRRIETREPPGYLDKKKEDDYAAGDFLVWEQVLCEAADRNCDVLFVTGDVKEDWWRRSSGESRGPRLELVREMHDPRRRKAVHAQAGGSPKHCQRGAAGLSE